MENLLDVTVKNVVYFANNCPDEKRQFIEDVFSRIKNRAQNVVLDFFSLVLQLKTLRIQDNYRQVLNANGEPYDYDSFYQFCEDIFGFSKTKVQNMIALSELVNVKDGVVKFVNSSYSNYSVSQLIELSSAWEWQKRYFSSSMTIKEMRLVKKYLVCHSGASTPEETLERAKRYAEDVERKREALSKKEESSFDDKDRDILHNISLLREAIDEYLTLWPFSVEARKNVIKYAQEHEASLLAVYFRREVANGYVKANLDVKEFKVAVAGEWQVYHDKLKEYGVKFIVGDGASSVVFELGFEEIAKRVKTAVSLGKYGFEDEYPMPPIGTVQELQDDADECDPEEFSSEDCLDEEDVEQSVFEDVENDVENAESVDNPGGPTLGTKSYKDWNLSSRDGRRQFLAEYDQWTKISNPIDFSFFAKNVYSIYIEPLHVVIYAVETSRMVAITDCVCEDTVLYYVHGNDFSDPTYISKVQLEEYLSRRLYKL